MSLPWDKQRMTENTEVHEVAEKFIQANCYNPAVFINIGKPYILHSTSLNAREEKFIHPPSPPNDRDL